MDFILEQFGKKFRLLFKHKLKTNQQKSQGRKWYLGQFHEIIIFYYYMSEYETLECCPHYE